MGKVIQRFFQQGECARVVRIGILCIRLCALGECANNLARLVHKITVIF